MLLLVMISMYVSLMREGSSSPSCSTFQRPVVEACTKSYEKGDYATNLFLDTSTGPKYQQNRCQCVLSIFNGSRNFTIQADEDIKKYNHNIKVDDLVLNSTNRRLDVVLKSNNFLWITTNGVGGVCVSVSAKSSAELTSFSIRCFATNYAPATTTTTKTAAPNTTTSHTTATQSESYFPGQDDGSIVGPVAGGICGFVVLVATPALALCYIRKSKKKEHGRHSAQEQNVTENQVSYKAATDHHDFLMSDDNYDNFALEHDTGHHMKKKMEPIRQTHAENDYYYASDIDHSIENPVNKGVVMQKEENLAVYSTVNKHPKQLNITTQDPTVYDRTGKIKLRAAGFEEYNRLGAFQDEDTYDSAATNKGGDERPNVQKNYDTS